MIDRYCLIDMFAPFYGENWYPPEIADDLTFRWTEPEASIRTPTLGARDLRLRWTFSILPQDHQLQNLRWLIGERHVAPQWAMRSGYMTLWGDVHLDVKEPAIKVSIAVPHRLRTSSDNVEDTRTLGLAVHKLEIFALSPEALGVEVQRLQGELEAREKAMSALQNSTSWKISRPLRWLKESLGGGGTSRRGS